MVDVESLTDEDRRVYDWLMANVQPPDRRIPGYDLAGFLLSFGTRADDVLGRFKKRGWLQRFSIQVGPRWQMCDYYRVTIEAVEAFAGKHKAVSPKTVPAKTAGKPKKNESQKAEPRYVPPNCPKCGGKMTVTSKQGRKRYLGCTCGHTSKTTMTAATTK